MNGSIIALFSASCFAASNICTRRGGLLVRDASLGVYISVFLAPPLFLFIALAVGDAQSIGRFTWLGYLWLVTAGIVHFVGGRSFNYLAIRHMGANLVILFSGLNLLYTVLLGLFLLRETINLNIGVGALLILMGPMLLAWSPRNEKKNPKPAVESKPKLNRKGIVFALLSGILFGVSPLFVKWGLQQGGSPLAGTFISYTGAMMVLGLTLGNRERRRGVFSMGRKELIWFALAGLFVALAQLLRYTALNLSPVSVASPLIATNPLFLLLLSFLVNRQIESFRPTIIAGAVMVVAGAVFMYR